MAFFRTLGAHQAVADLAARGGPQSSSDIASLANGVRDRLQHSARPDDILSRARLTSSRAGLDATMLTSALHQGPAVVARLATLRRLLSQDHVFGHLYPRSHAPFLDRDEAYRAALLKIRRLKELKERYAWDEADMCLVHELVDEAMPLYIHVCLFIPTLEHSCTPQQRDQWLKAARDWRIIGAYAQTELGHGSNVRGGLETTATFDPHAPHGGGFVLHTPTLTARKWWPGGLAQSVTHALVYARLLADGRDYGPNAFLVQIRDLQTGRNVPGVATGNIGPKVGFHAIDNGWMTLDKVSVPCDALISASYSVQGGSLRVAEGSSPVLSYRTMLGARFGIINLGGRVMAKATLIAIRFALTRRQFKHRAKAEENPVFSYASQQWRLLVPLATSYVFHLASLELLDALGSEGGHGQVLANLKASHVQASALKVYTTAVATAALEEMRRSLGGHGYSKAAAIPDLAASFLQMVTVEGDNYVISQQAGRRIVQEMAKLLDAGRTREPSLSSAMFSYLAHAVKTEGPEQIVSAQALAQDGALQTRLFERAAASAALSAHRGIERARRDGLTDEEAWDANLLLSDTAVYAFAMLSIHDRFGTVRERLQGQSEANLAHQLLGALHVLWWTSATLTSPNPLSGISTPLVLALKHEIIRPTAVSIIEEAAQLARETIAPHALALAEAWDFNDWELGTPLARVDGNLYEGLVEWAASDPMNTRHRERNREVWLDVLGPLVSPASEAAPGPATVAPRL